MDTATQKYYELIKKEIKPATDIPAVHSLALAIHSFVQIKMAEYDYDIQVQRMLKLREQMREEAKRQRDKDDNSGLLTIIKIATLGAVAVFAPPLLTGALPCIGAVGSISNAVATGVAVGAADTLVQGVAVALDAQGSFSLNEVLESTVSACVGAKVTKVSIATKALSMSGAAAATQAAEIALNLRKEFDLKDIALQGAASIVADSIKAAMPDLEQRLGSEQAAKVVRTAANSAIGAVLNTTVTGQPISLQNIAASIVGNVAGEEIGSMVSDSLITNHTETSIKNPQDKQSKKFDKDKICYVNDVADNPLNNMTTTQSTNMDEYDNLIAHGKLAEAKQLILDRAAKYLSNSEPNEAPTINLSKPDPKTSSSTKTILTSLSDPQINKTNLNNTVGWRDYVDASISGVESFRDNVLCHPIDTLVNTAITAWDGYNAIGDVTFGISTQGSRERNLRRGILINDKIDDVINGDGPTRTRILSELSAAFVFGGAIGAGFETAADIIGLATVGNKYSGAEAANIRVDRLLKNDVGYNVTPEAWFNDFPAIGKEGTFITDYEAIKNILGPVEGNTSFKVGLYSHEDVISYLRTRALEKTLGLQPGSLKDGFRLSKIFDLNNRHPRSPLLVLGNSLFKGPGEGLPGGGPELVIDSIPTIPWPMRSTQ